MSSGTFEAKPTRLRIADMVSALSYALDLTGGQEMGWAVRTCRLGMRLAEVLELSGAQRAALYYALLLKDSGCSSNAARVVQIFNGDDLRVKRETRLLDWNALTWEGFRIGLELSDDRRGWPRRLWRTLRVGLHRRRHAIELVQLRCERGADITLKMGLPAATAEAIRCLDERWDGSGAPRGLCGNAIPLLAQVVGVAQTMALFTVSGGAAAAAAVVRRRRGRWFSPELAQAALGLTGERALWRQERADEVRRQVLDLDPGEVLHADETAIDNLCTAFADVIDAKSAFTSRHSRGVEAAASAMAAQFDLPAETRALVRRAALLHDIGKLGISNRILEKPGRLTPTERARLMQHAAYSEEILSRVTGWQRLAFIAAAHHERLDGSGYHRGLHARQLPLEARLIAVADVYDALSSARPYRGAVEARAVFAHLEAAAPRALDADCVAALRAACRAAPALEFAAALTTVPPTLSQLTPRAFALATRS